MRKLYITGIRQYGSFPRALKPSSQQKRGRVAFQAVALAVGLLAGGNLRPAMAQYRLNSFDVPNATITFARGINNQGQVVGAYTDTNFNTGGFIFDGQNFTLINVPNALSTELNDINDAGTTIGSYVSADDFSTHNFQSNGAGMTEMDFPGAASTTLQGINNLGHISGFYSELGDSQAHGFVFNGSDFVSFDAPGVRPNTFPGGLNDNRTLVGSFSDTRSHGFIHDGTTLTPFDLPGATDTFVSDINNQGAIVGFFETNDNNPRTGFVLRDGKLTTIAFPEAVFTNLTSINDHGTILGYYADANDQIHGFIATPVPEPTLALWLIAVSLTGGFTFGKRRTRWNKHTGGVA